MGGGSWSSDFYTDREAVRARSNAPVFAYHETVSKRARHEQKVHANLDPKGVLFRESRDIEGEHPESNAIAVFFDVTGSMNTIPGLLQKKLPALMDTLNASGYIKDPQVFFGAVGDTTCDRGSLQVGQFESDNRVTEAFEHMWLEGGGGGSMQESYQNAMYFASRHMSCDCFEKRKKKGFLFLIGDERPYDFVSSVEIERLMGAPLLQADLPIKELVDELKEKFHVFMIIPTQGYHGSNSQVQTMWKDLLGSNVLFTDDIESICEIISLAVGITEGTVTSLDQARSDLQGNGSNMGGVNSAIASVGALLTENPSVAVGRTTRL